MGIDALSVNDPSSFSNTGSFVSLSLNTSGKIYCFYFAPEDAVIRHAHIVWQVNFSKHTLAGSVKLTFEKVKDTVDKVVSYKKNLIKHMHALLHLQSRPVLLIKNHRQYLMFV